MLGSSQKRLKMKKNSLMCWNYLQGAFLRFIILKRKHIISVISAIGQNAREEYKPK